MAMVQALSARGATATAAASNAGSTAKCIQPLSQSPAAASASVLDDQNTTTSAIDQPPLGDHKQDQADTQDEQQPVVDIVINNVVAAFCVRCHLDLKYIAMNGDNVEYRRENGMVTMKLRNPYTTASMWSSGKITCTGATSEQDARTGARRVARYLQTRLNYRVKFANYRVVNVLGTCCLPFAIKIADFSQKYPKSACYEPELHPGVTFRIETLRATLKVFSTGSMTITASSVSKVSAAVEEIFPLVHEFRKEKPSIDVGNCTRVMPRRHCGSAAAVADLSDCDANDDDDEDDDCKPPAKYFRLSH